MKWLNYVKIRLMLVVFVVAIVIGGGNVYADFTFGEPTNMGPSINSPYSDFTGSFSSDGLEMYFDSNRSGGSWDTYDIYVSTRATTDDAWGTPMKLGPPVNSSSVDAGAIISTDGLSLYFTSLNRAGGYGVLDIWLTTRESIDDDWGEPSNLGPTINTSQDELDASISCDGRVLYFCRKPPPDGPGDIYISTRPTTNDPWGEPVNLGPTVNSSSSDRSPCISPNGLVLLFSSNRPGGFGDRDLYMTRRATIDDDWAIPVNLGPMINTSAYDGFVTILPDGSTLLFASNRPGGFGDVDLWQAPILPIVDLNADGIVDAADMCIMVDYWGTDDSLCDIGPMPWGDGVVDVQDLKVLAEHLFEEVDDPTLIAHWPLDEVQGDIAYNNASDCDGTLIGDPVWQPIEGKRGGSLDLDGIDDYIETDFILSPADGKFSVFAWIKGGAAGQVIISQADGSGSSETWLGITASDGNLMTGLVPPPVGRFRPEPLESQSVVTDGQWHHVGFAWDGSYRYLYVDGIEVARDTQAITAAPLKHSDGGLYIGTSKTLDVGTFFSGLIDDVRIYNAALSAEQITALSQ
jgi:Tol biopolymer transport system component